MEKKFFFVCLLVVFAQASLSFSANQEKKYFFISPDIGFMLTARDDYNFTSYQTKLGFQIGGSFGIAISKRIHLYSKLAYFPKSPIKMTLTARMYDLNGNFIGERQFKSKIQSQQLFFNVGFLYHIYAKRVYDFYLSGGVNYTHANETAKNGNTIADATASGYFIGFSAEKDISHAPFKIVSHLQYAKSANMITGPGIGPRSAFILALGLNYYF